MLGRGTEEGSSNEKALISLRRPGRRPRLFFNYISTAVFYIFVFPYSNVAYEKEEGKKKKQMMSTLLTKKHKTLQHKKLSWTSQNLSKKNYFLPRPTSVLMPLWMR